MGRGEGMDGAMPLICLVSDDDEKNDYTMGHDSFKYAIYYMNAI